MPSQEFDFFRCDEEFASDGEAPYGLPVTSSEGPQDMLVKLLEIGGDFIQELMARPHRRGGRLSMPGLVGRERRYSELPRSIAKLEVKPNYGESRSIT